MVKQGVVNFLKSLKYFFTPLGTMFLGVMLGFSVLIPGIAGAVNSLIAGVKNLSANVNLDFAALAGDLWASVRALDWGNPSEALGTLFSGGWLRENLTRILQSVLGTDFETFNMQVVGLCKDFADAVTLNIVVFAVFWILGFVAGFFIVRFRIRKDIARRSFWKLALAAVVNSVLAAAFLVAAAVLFAMWGWSAIISGVLLVILTGIAALAEAYFIHGRGKVGPKQIINLKNAGLYALSNLIIFAIAAVITAAACLINAVLGIFIGMAVVEIAICVIDLNAEAYVKSIAGQQPPASGSSDKNPAVKQA